MLLAAQSGLDVLTFTGSSGETITDEAELSTRRSFSTSMKNLPKRENNDSGRIEKLEGDLEAVGNELLKATGFNDRPRTKSDMERARINVTMAINRAD